MPEIRAFVLPGGHLSVSFCHIARAICRRAERLTVALYEKKNIDILVISYLNRLSDYLFVLSRAIAQHLNVKETFWKSK